jgi:hypothetical protein
MRARSVCSSRDPGGSLLESPECGASLGLLAVNGSAQQTPKAGAFHVTRRAACSGVPSAPIRVIACTTGCLERLRLRGGVIVGPGGVGESHQDLGDRPQ